MCTRLFNTVEAWLVATENPRFNWILQSLKRCGKIFELPGKITGSYQSRIFSFLFVHTSPFEFELFKKLTMLCVDLEEFQIFISCVDISSYRTSPQVSISSNHWQL